MHPMIALAVPLATSDQASQPVHLCTDSASLQHASQSFVASPRSASKDTYVSQQPPWQHQLECVHAAAPHYLQYTLVAHTDIPALGTKPLHKRPSLQHMASAISQPSCCCPASAHLAAPPAAAAAVAHSATCALAEHLPAAAAAAAAALSPGHRHQLLNPQQAASPC